MGLEAELETLIQRAVSKGVAEGVAEGTSRVLAELRGGRGDSSAKDIAADDEIDTQTAARLAHVKPRTITEWVRRGWLTPSKKGRSYIFRAGDVASVAHDRQGPRKVVKLDLRQSAQKILKDRR